MAKKQIKECTSLKEALETFDLRVFKRYVQKNDPLLWNDFEDYNAKVQKAIMAKMICNRTDMLGTEAHKKAVSYLKDNDMKGRIF